ncbi:MAG: D-alanyl-D-alanine carboxypeptidase [Oscillospiraceae bacterium]|nr:D-alanyl-D-alanine carboxypeptidase [Oscillospiraceae bacterium]
MKKFRILCVILCFIMVLQLAGVAVFATETTEETTAETTEATEAGPAIEPEGEIPTVTGFDASISNGCHTLSAMVPLGGSEAMLETARSAILYELNSGTLLYAYYPDERVYPASLVKIMTALLVVEDGNLNQSVTVTQSALDSVPYDAISISIRAGETLTMKDLLYSMMVASANDACAVIAEEISGSQEAFVALMNQRAKELGCTGTQFVNSHGVHNEQQYTTARDMGRILEAALKYEEFREAFSATGYIVPANELSEARNLITTNYFMSKESGVVKFYDSRVTGGKSGAVSNSDRSMACTAESGDMQLMSIVMGAKGTEAEDGYTLDYFGNFEETMELLDWGFQYFMVSQILYEGKSVAQFPVTNGENQVVGRPIKTVYSALPYGSTVDHLVWKYLQQNDGLTAPVKKDDAIGTVQVWYGSICLAQSDMVAMNPAKESTNAGDVSTNPAVIGENESGLGWFLKILGMIFAVIVVVAIIFIALRLVRGAVIHTRRRRRRKNRRRSR